MRSHRIAPLLVALPVLLFARLAGGHSERPIASPVRSGVVPDPNRVSEHVLVVCKPSSKPTKDEHRDIHQRLATETGPALAQAQAEEVAWHRNARLFRKCRYEHIQAAVNAAEDHTTIYVLPGVYREEPSRAAPTTTSGDLPDGSYSFPYHVAHPNDANLIGILGKRDLTLEGTGVTPRDVVIDAGFVKDIGIRCDRCAGFIVRNLWQRDANEHGIYVVDSDGYIYDRTVASYNKAYELFAFASDHGVFQDCEAIGGGDSGIYVGGAPDTHAQGRFSAVIQRCKMYHNALGFSGTQGNSVHMIQNDIFDNAIGISFDSENDHPNFPQRYSVIEDNDIHDNNHDVYAPTSDVPVHGPGYDFFRYPVGTGMWIVGGENNVIQNNRFYSNQRFGLLIAANPLETPLLAKVNRNTIVNNLIGKDSLGNSLPNSTAFPPGGDFTSGGSDFLWDETGLDNCWGPQDPASGPIKYDPVAIPGPCPFPNGIDTVFTSVVQKLHLLVNCSLTQVPGSNPPEYVTNDISWPCPWGHTNDAPYRSAAELECGNGALDLGEDCDAGNGGYGGGATSETCERLGLGSGPLACNDDCVYDPSGCGIQSCGRTGTARVRLKELDAPAGDDEMDIVLNDVDGSGRTFDPTTEEVSLVVREDPTRTATPPTLFYLRTIPAGAGWTAGPGSYTFTDPPGPDALRVMLTTEGSFAGPFRGRLQLLGGSLGSVVGARTATVVLRVGDDCWRGELPCAFSRTGRGGVCRKARRP